MAQFVTGTARVRVPASSANLGPGFDSLGLALGLHDVVSAEVLPIGEPVISVSGEGADDVPRDGSHLVYRSMLRGFWALGLDAPGIRLHCENAIPHGRGLGSSSAAIVGGLAVARALVVDGAERMSDEALFELAAELEGHPDNVAPAVYGGFTIAYSTGSFRALRLEVSPRLSFVVLVPPDPLQTVVARGLLPETVPHADASFNAGRAALLVAALTRHPERLLAATEDRLHQGYRAPAMPRSGQLVDALRGDGIPAVVSGAGPTVLAVLPPERVDEVVSRAPLGWWVRELPVDVDGVRAEPLP